MKINLFVLTKNLFLGEKSRGWVLLLFLMLLSTACQKDEQLTVVNPPTTAISPPIVTVFRNWTDSRIFRIKIDSTYVVDFYGSRDISGKPNQLTMVTLFSCKDEEATTLLLDEEERISSIFQKDGSSAFLQWINSDAFTFSLITSDGSNQFNSEYSQSASRLSQQNYTNLKGTFPRGNKGITISSSSLINSSPSRVQKNLNQVSINVTSCNGKPIDADHVGLWTYRTEDFTSLNDGMIPAKKIAPGKYSVTLPSQLPEDYIVTAKGACEVALDWGQVLLEKDFSEGLLLVSEGIVKSSNLLIGGQVDPAIEKQLQKIDNVIDLIQFAKDIFSPNKWPLIVAKQDACKANFDDNTGFNFGGLTYIAQAHLAGKGEKRSQGGLIYADSKGPYPDANIDFGSLPWLSPIQLNPVNPSAGNGYQASIKLGCLPPGSTVEMNVIGTDGYQDTDTQTVQGNDSFETTLNVPGAATSGIEDVITVIIHTPNGIETRKASLVFQ